MTPTNQKQTMMNLSDPLLPVEGGVGHLHGAHKELNTETSGVLSSRSVRHASVIGLMKQESAINRHTKLNQTSKM